MPLKQIGWWKSRSSQPVATCQPTENPGKILTDALKHFEELLSPDEALELRQLGTESGAGTNPALAFVVKLQTWEEAHFDGKYPSSADRFRRVLQSVWEFSTVVDVFVSSNPEIAALVWGSVKFGIMALLNLTSWFQPLSELFKRIVHLCPTFDSYQKLYLKSTRVQTAICNFYACIVKTLRHVVDVEKRNRVEKAQRLFRSFEDEFQPFENEIRDCGNDVMREVNLAKAEADSKTRNTVEKIDKDQSARDLVLHEKGKQSLINNISSHDYGRPYTEARGKKHRGTAEWIFELPQYNRWTCSNTPSLLLCHGKIGAGKTVLMASIIDRVLRGMPQNGDCYAAFFFIRRDDPETQKADVVLRAVLKQILQSGSLSDETVTSLRNPSGFYPTLEELVELLRHSILCSKAKRVYLLIDGLNEIGEKERWDLIDSLRSLFSTIPCLKIALAVQESLLADIKEQFASSHLISMASQAAAADIGLFVQDELDQRRKRHQLIVKNDDLFNSISTTLKNHADGMFLWVTYLIDELCMHQRDRDVERALGNLPKTLEETFNRALERIGASGKYELAHSTFQWISVATRSLTIGELREAISLKILQEFLDPADTVNDIERIAGWCQNLVQVDAELSTIRFSHSSIRDFIVKSRAAPSLQKFHFEVADAEHYAGEICLTYLHLNNFKTGLTQRAPEKPKMNIPTPQNILDNAITSVPGARFLSRPLGLRQEGNTTVAIYTDPTEYNRTTGSDDSAFRGVYHFLDYARSHWFSHTRHFEEGRSRAWKLLKRMIEHDHPLAQYPWPHGSEHKIDKAYQTNHYALLDLLLASDESKRLVRQRSYIQLASHKANLIFLDECLARKEWSDKCVMGEGLVAASSHGVSYLVERLLSAGAEVSAKSMYGGHTAFELASLGGHLPVVRLLLKAGARNFGKGGYYRLMGGRFTALTNASREGHLEIVELLLAEGEDAEAYEEDGRIKALVSQNILGPPLHAASSSGHVKIVQILLDAGAQVNDSGEDSSTALYLASSSGHVKIVQILLDAGAQVNDSGEDSSTPLRAALSSNYLEIVQILLDAGAGINSPDAQGYTPLHIASSSKQVKIVQILLDAGAQVNKPDTQGYTPLYIASESGNVEMVQILLDAGAHVNSQDELDYTFTPLYAALTSGYLDVVDLLLKSGGNHTVTKDICKIARKRGHRNLQRRLKDAMRASK